MQLIFFEEDVTVVKIVSQHFEKKYYRKSGWAKKKEEVIKLCKKRFATFKKNAAKQCVCSI
jgi:hypothetical protein